MITDSMNRVAVVVPVYKSGLEPDEQISQRQLVHFLGKFDKYLVAPESLDFSLEEFEIKRFRDEFFHSTATYSALLLTREFYEAFADYDYILIYQLDCLVFSDQLLEWCAKDIDYVGAPWFAADGTDFVAESAVGNGGLSLRKIASFLKVIDSPGFAREIDKYRDALVAAGPWSRRLKDGPRKLRRRLSLSLAKRQDILGQTGPVPPGERLNEDCFWSFKARDYRPDFKIASVAEALHFSFEKAPRSCFERNAGQLPFGCHAWNKYDRHFWEPFLLK
jgi:hypothetical protein